MINSGKATSDTFQTVPLRARQDVQGQRWLEIVHILGPNAAGYPAHEELKSEMYQHVQARLAENIPGNLLEKKERYEKMVADIQQRELDLIDKKTEQVEARKEAFLEGSANKLAKIDEEICQTADLIESNANNLTEAQRLAESVQGEIEAALVPLLPGFVREITDLPPDLARVVSDLKSFLANNEAALLEINRRMASSYLYSPNRQGSWFSALRSFCTNAAKDAVAQIPVEA